MIQQDHDIEAVRGFGRFYTERLGALRRSFLDSPFGLPEARALYEISRESPGLGELARKLGLDAGYVSRLVSGLRRRGFCTVRAQPGDRRVRRVVLTRRGREAFGRLDAAQNASVAGMLDDLGRADRRRLLGAMKSIQELLGPAGDAQAPYLLRTHGPGDAGWVLEMHGRLYSHEQGWGASFEALVARILTKFLEGHDADRERLWIAERDGRRVGSVMLVRKSRRTAQLRLLLVEPSARGLGIGARLVSECSSFARRTGYRRIVLWTNGGLDAARRIYEAEGYRLVEESPNRTFGDGLVGQHWALEL